MVETDRIETTYNLEVEGYHTYFAGDANVWVHNNNCDLPTSWISRKVWNDLTPTLRTKFANAQAKGIVAPKGSQGIIKLSDTEAMFKQDYTHKLKILGTGGDLRIYGKQAENGHIIFDNLRGH